jgi:hypothetical protein
MVLFVGSYSFLLPTALAQHEHPVGDSTKLGKVNFPVSCDPSVQQQFSSAVAMLHSFWYEKASETFAAVAEKDPGVWHGVLGDRHDLLPSDLASARPG